MNLNKTIDIEIVIGMDMDGGNITEVERTPTNSPHHTPLNVEDYIFRGDELEGYSIYELSMVSYNRGTDKMTMERYRQRDRSPVRQQSRKWNRRVFFRSAHSQAESRWTVFQKLEKVPCVVGKR